jgi:hypothetical protein
LCGFCRNTNLSILLFYFSSKNYNSKVYTYLEKVVVLVTLRTSKLILIFLDFLRFLIDFTRRWTQTQNREESFYAADPRTFKIFTRIPSALPPGPDGGGELTGGEVGHGKVNMLRGSLIGLNSA